MTPDHTPVRAAFGHLLGHWQAAGCPTQHTRGRVDPDDPPTVVLANTHRYGVMHTLALAAVLPTAIADGTDVVVDVGCGWGSTAIALAAAGIDVPVVAYDHHPYARLLARCCTAAAGIPPDGHIVVGRTERIADAVDLHLDVPTTPTVTIVGSHIVHQPAFVADPTTRTAVARLASCLVARGAQVRWVGVEPASYRGIGGDVLLQEAFVDAGLSAVTHDRRVSYRPWYPDLGWRGAKSVTVTEADLVPLPSRRSA